MLSTSIMDSTEALCWHTTFALKYQLYNVLLKDPHFFPQCIRLLLLSEDHVSYTPFIAYIQCNFFFSYTSEHTIKKIISAWVFLLIDILSDSISYFASFWVPSMKLSSFFSFPKTFCFKQLLLNSFIARKSKALNRPHIRSLPSSTKMKEPINDHLGKVICLTSHSNYITEAGPKLNYPTEASNCFNHATTHFFLTIPSPCWLHLLQIKPPYKRQQFTSLRN